MCEKKRAKGDMGAHVERKGLVLLKFDEQDWLLVVNRHDFTLRVAEVRLSATSWKRKSLKREDTQST